MPGWHTTRKEASEPQSRNSIATKDGNSAAAGALTVLGLNGPDLGLEERRALIPGASVFLVPQHLWPVPKVERQW